MLENKVKDNPAPEVVLFQALFQSKTQSALENKLKDNPAPEVEGREIFSRFLSAFPKQNNLYWKTTTT